jgi:hypothetical protein
VSLRLSGEDRRSLLSGELAGGTAIQISSLSRRGVTPLVVQRRIRLGNVSPRLLTDYRADTVTLYQLMALALTDDHEAQEAAFYDAWNEKGRSVQVH